MEPARGASETAGYSPHPLDIGSGAAERGQLLDTSSPPVSGRLLTEDDLHSPLQDKWKSLLLLVATCLSTFWAGATNWMPFAFLDDRQAAAYMVATHWRQGLAYMLAVMAILVTHEMGHLLQAVRYRVPASFPWFLPVPIMLTGTMGAVIRMDGSRANRKQLFDIGLTGPLAGLVVAIPMIWFGLNYAQPDPDAFELRLGTPLVFKLIGAWVRPDLETGVLFRQPLFMAGWVGMLITGLNMLPVSQLDGGHVIYGLFGRHAKWVARGFVLAAIAFIVIEEQYNWVVMLVLVLLLGVDHPPTADDNARLGPVRWLIGLTSLLIPVFCFTPVILPGN